MNITNRGLKILIAFASLSTLSIHAYAKAKGLCFWNNYYPEKATGCTRHLYVESVDNPKGYHIRLSRACLKKNTHGIPRSAFPVRVCLAEKKHCTIVRTPGAYTFSRVKSTDGIRYSKHKEDTECR